MYKLVIAVLLNGVLFLPVYAQFPTRTYLFFREPVDVVIPSIEKDLLTLELCIESVKKYVHNVRRIIVVSDKKLTDQAEWFDEKQYPFTKLDVAQEIFQDATLASLYLTHPKTRIGWIYQQLLKLYAPLVISGISSNVLVVDSDAIFLRPAMFIDANGCGLYGPGTRENSYFLTYMPYVDHMRRLHPDLTKLWSDFTGIAHHMLFQRPVIEDLFQLVEEHHGADFWRCFCRAIDPKHTFRSPCSEYEIYLSFLFSRTQQCKLRLLKWKDVKTLDDLSKLQAEGYHYVACHSYGRK